MSGRIVGKRLNFKASLTVTFAIDVKLLKQCPHCFRIMIDFDLKMIRHQGQHGF